MKSHRIALWRVSLALLGCIALSDGASAQQTANDDVAQGKALLGLLSQTEPRDVAADEAVFHQVGVVQAEKLLFAVQADGHKPSATAQDWVAMHRALDALIELNAGEKAFLKASIYATLQESAYRRNDGDYTAALASARQALELQVRSGAVESVWIPWKSVGEDLIHLGRLDEGAAALEESRRLVPDPTAGFAGDLWAEIVALESSRGNAAVAHRDSEAFLAAATPDTPPAFRANALLAAANLAVDDLRYDDAIARVHQALAAIKGTPDPTMLGYQVVNTLLALGMAAMQTMPYRDALNLCDRLGKDFPGLPISVSGAAHEIANHRRRLAGEFDAVLRDDAAQLEQARAAKDVSGQVAALTATAVDFSYLRETRQQVAALDEAAELVHSPAVDGIAPQLRFRTLNLLGAAQRAGGDLRKANAAYTEVLVGIEAVSSAQTRAQLGVLYADAQLGKAALMEREGDLTGARTLLHESAHPAPGGLGRFDPASVLLQNARLEQAADSQPEEAIRLYLAAIATLKQAKDVNTEVFARLQLAQYLAGKAKNPSYAAQAQEQLALARTASASIGLSDTAWRIQFIEGILKENTGDPVGAMRSYTGAIAGLDRIRAGLSQEEERQSFVDTASTQELYRRQIGLMTAAGDRNGAWEALERNKARSFLETLHGRRFAAVATATPNPHAGELETLEREILAARISLSPEGESALRDSGRLPEAVRQKLASLEASFVLARQQQAVTDSRATQPLALRPIGLVATQAKLPEHTALIEYAILDHELAAFVVTRHAATELHWAADPAALTAQLRRLRGQLSAAKPAGDLDAQLKAASEILLAPVLRALPPLTDELVIVPTQALSAIPFEALPLPADRNGPAGLAIDRFAVAYLPSASTLQFLSFGGPSASADLFLGALGDLSVEGWPALPGTLVETAAIQAMYPGAIRVTGPAFTHDAAVDALRRHQEVHFATHGLFDEGSPLFSAVVTAPATGQPSRLSLYEVMDLNVKSRLVILSACETDRGQVTGGDEMVGLTRTFLQAGAESVVSSLWKVSDESTALLMESLHRYLRLGETTPVALRHAQLETRNKFAQPFYWAAFVETGLR